MPKITYVAHDGTQTQIDAAVGDTVLSAALDHNIRGVDGDCGGNCACATCHVFIASPWAELLPPTEEQEDIMLEFTAERQGTSRLGCQIRVTEALDGMVVQMPEAQH